MNLSFHGRFFLGLVLVLSASMGCYTVLKHPRVPTDREIRDEYDVGHDRVSFVDNCQSCHTSGIEAYHAIAVPAPAPEPSWRWRYYYDTPWWYPYYTAPGNTADENDQSKRPFDRRRMSAPEESASGAGAPAAPLPPPAAGGALARPAASEAEAPAAETPKEEDSNKRSARRSSDGDSGGTGSRRTPKP